MANSTLLILSGLLLCTQPGVWAAPIILDFEGFADSTSLTNQYSGLSFSNSIVLTAGISLDEFEFPSHSGSNVLSDNGGPITVTFASPITTFLAYFTYSTRLTLKGFNATHGQLATATSAFSNNEALSGVSGSSSNELIFLSFPGGLSSIEITGDLAGGSFALDDATLTTAVPEPSTLSAFLAGVVILAGLHKYLTRHSNYSL